MSLNIQHGKWIGFLQQYNLILNTGLENQVADDWVKVKRALTSITIQVLGFDLIKQERKIAKIFE